MSTSSVNQQYEALLSRYKAMQTKAYTKQDVGEKGDTSLSDLKKQLTTFVDAYGSADQKAKMQQSFEIMDTAIENKLSHATKENANWDEARGEMEALLSDLKTSSGASTAEQVWTPGGATPRPAAIPSKSGSTAAGSVSVPKVAVTSTVSVKNAAELKAALAKASPGTEIYLEGGTYAGPIKMQGLRGVTISGSKDATIETGPKGTSLSMVDCQDCSLTGFTVKGGQKTLMADHSSGNVFDSLDLSGSQMEVLHLRKNSSNNVVQGCSIHDSGKGGDTAAGHGRTQAMDGEGIYIGTAKSNSSSDASNNNKIIGNHIFNTTAENIDIKEFTSGGTISGNTLDGEKMGSDIKANVLIKGSDYTASGNTVTNKRNKGIRSMTISGAENSGKNNKIS
jgi:hypothetical protein